MSGEFRSSFHPPFACFQNLTIYNKDVIVVTTEECLSSLYPSLGTRMSIHVLILEETYPDRPLVLKKSIQLSSELNSL